MTSIDEKAREAARVAWLESASEYKRLDASIDAAIDAYLAALPPSTDLIAVVKRERQKLATKAEVQS